MSGYFLDEGCPECGEPTLRVNCWCSSCQRPPCSACEKGIARCTECDYVYTQADHQLKELAQMDTITLLQIDAGCHLYECSYSTAPKAQRYTFKSFERYEVGTYAFVLPSGVNEHDHARVVRVEGPAAFSEEIERYRWLCGPAVLPDMQEGERIDTNARRKIALGGAIAAAKASAAGLTLEDYTPPAITKSEETDAS